MTLPVATLDFETRSYADLKKVGAWAYAEDFTTDVICCAWGIDREPIQTWWPGKHKNNDMPNDLLAHIVTGGLVEAHNVSFEKAIWKHVMVRYGWPEIPAEQWRDTMAVAAYYALPLALDRLAYALGFQGKDPDGARLITKYSKLYLKTAKEIIPLEDFEKFVAYCVKDVQIEQSISDYLGDLPARELPLWLLDQEINERGLYLDRAGIDRAAALVDRVAGELSAEYYSLTGVNPTQRDASMVWFGAHGFPLENMRADYLEELLENIPQGAVRRAIEIRLEINKASTKKLDAMARQVNFDGRARFQTRYHGAQTGRTAGTGFQPLNLNRGFSDMDPDQLVADIMLDDPAWLTALYGNAMDAVAKASRYWIMADRGNKIVSGDFVSIEAVVLACLADEQWKIDAFTAGVKIYEHMADKIYNLPPGTVTKATHPMERQDGKIGELAFGYQGALGAWLKFDDSGRHTDEAILRICRAWRDEHPATVAFWWNLENAALNALRAPGTRQDVGAIVCQTVDEWLSMRLPGNKCIWYYRPEIRVGLPHWHQPAYDPVTGEPNDHAAGSCDCRPVPKLTYMANKEGQWKRVYTYGGKLAENATQATAREILAHASLRVEAAGYPIILTVYDEIVTEPEIGFGSAEELAAIMSDGPTWAHGWPIRVEAWESGPGGRYRK